MKRPPKNSSQPPLSQAPGTTFPLSVASGVKGRKFWPWTLPAMSGITQTMNSGSSEATVRMVEICAVRRMPRCWMAKTTSMMAAPRMKVALMRSVRSFEMKPRSTSVHCQLLIGELASKKIDSR